MLVHVKAVALDPQHPKVIRNFNRFESPNACVLAGTVAKLDEGVAKFKKGDRVLAVTFGLDMSGERDNFFKSVAEDHISCHIPEPFSFDQACSIGILMATAGRALFQAPGLELSLQHGKNETVLVSGGSTALGTMATQVLKMAGYKPIVSCPYTDNSLCESYGATACFDTKSPTCGADIRIHTNDSLNHALDCVNDALSMKMCYEAIGSSGGNYIAIEMINTTVKYTRKDVHAEWFLAGEVMGDGVLSPEYKQFGKHFFALAEKWFHEGMVRPHPPQIMANA